MPTACPVCGKDDMIQKVTAIYSAGTANSSYTGTTTAVATPTGSGKSSVAGGVTSMSGVTQTNLAQKIAPPRKPQVQSISCFWYALPFIPLLQLIMVVLAFYAPISKKIKLFILGGFLTFGIGGLIMLGVDSSASIQYIDFVGAIEGVGLAIAAIAYYVGLYQETKKRNSDFIQQGYIESWEKMMSLWNELYYCSRDDNVFSPRSGVSVSVEQMNKLLQ